MEPEPTSLQEAIEYFSNTGNCRDYVVARRWRDGVTCPTCGCTDVIFLTNQSRWQCRNKHSKRQFSLKTGTIYEDSPLGLDKWLVATWLVSNCKNGVSSWRGGAGAQHHPENRVVHGSPNPVFSWHGTGEQTFRAG